MLLVVPMLWASPCLQLRQAWLSQLRGLSASTCPRPRDCKGDVHSLAGTSPLRRCLYKGHCPPALVLLCGSTVLARSRLCERTTEQDAGSHCLWPRQSAWHGAQPHRTPLLSSQVGGGGGLDTVLELLVQAQGHGGCVGACLALDAAHASWCQPGTAVRAGRVMWGAASVGGGCGA